MQTAHALSRHRLLFAGALIIALVVWLTYFPSLFIGFWMDDYIAIDLAGRLSGWDYLLKYFNPYLQRLWYRPMIGLQWKIEYLLFRGEPFGYHIVQTGLHLINCWLLYLLVKRLTRRTRVGLVAALLYATLPLSSMSVYWTSVHDPLAGVFYLLTIILWLDFLQSDSRVKFVGAFVTFLGALLTKEVSLTLPPILFLADRLLIHKPAPFKELVKRYLVFVVPLSIYAWCEWIVMTRSEFTQQIGYRVGLDTVYVFTKFLSFLAFPWEVDERVNYSVLIVLSVLFLFLVLTRKHRLWFLIATAILPTLIASPIPSHLFNPRYLYLPLMASTVGYALMFESILQIAQRWRWQLVARSVAVGILTLVVGLGSVAVVERTLNFGGFIRQIRLSFRPIFQQYPTFPPDTLLYFIDTPLQTLDISGLMFLHYGTNVTVSGVDRATISGLRDHANAWVWYLDESEQFKAQGVAKELQVQVTPSLPPLRFGNVIELDTLEVVNNRVSLGEAVVILARWRAVEWMDQNYTVFAHLVDTQGKRIVGNDSQPRKGLAPTTSWRVGSVLADGIIIPVPDQAGQYQVQIGWYNPATLERLPLVNAAGQVIGDAVVIDPFVVE